MPRNPAGARARASLIFPRDSFRWVFTGLEDPDCGLKRSGTYTERENLLLSSRFRSFRRGGNRGGSAKNRRGSRAHSAKGKSRREISSLIAEENRSLSSQVPCLSCRERERRRRLEMRSRDAGLNLNGYKCVTDVPEIRPPGGP